MALSYTGEMIADRFRIERKLGSGGFGYVYEATELGVERRVAVKVLKPDDGRGYKPATKARFEREARAVGQLQSPHTVTLIDFGESHGKLFMVFELVAGEDLRAIIDRDERLEPQVAVKILLQLLDSLDEAHRVGILHRDIKPANIRVFPWADNPTFVKLLDFGLARPTENGSPGITATGELIGTPRYMSPEQLSARPLTAASDIYSLGVVFLEMLIGAAPLQGNRWSDQFDRMMSGHIFSFLELQSIDPELVQLVHRMTTRDPAQRLASAAAVRHALLGKPKPARQQPEDATGRGLKPGAALLVGLVLLVALVLLVFTQQEEEPRAVVPEQPAANRPSPLSTLSPASPASNVQDAGIDSGSNTASDMGAEETCTPYAEHGWKPYRHFTERMGYTYIPKCYDPETAHPVVIFAPRERVHRWEFKLAPDFATLAQRRLEFAEETRLVDLADRHKFVILIPPGDYRWDDLENDKQATFDHLEDAESKLSLDRSRIYVLGDEIGGVLAYVLSNEPWVTAVAVFAFVPGEINEAQRPVWPAGAPSVPVLHVVPMSSNAVFATAGEKDDCLPNRPGYAHYAALWQKRNGCRSETQPSSLSDSCESFVGCDAELVSCKVEGGYHWPGTDRDKDIPKCGRERFAEIDDVEDVVWRFFSESPPLEPPTR